MSDIFISYARSSQQQADLVGERLRAAGYSVWRDNALPVHRPYPQVIEEQLHAAKAVVVIWSRDASRSQWVRPEANKAIGENKLVQVSIDDTLPPMPFDQVQCAELHGWDGDAAAPQWRKVLDSVAELIGARAAAPEPAAPAAVDAGAGDQIRLAVLPFDNLSGDPSFGYFSDGISEEILQTVARIAGVTVIARTSSFQFRGIDKSVRRVAADLNTSHLLDGSVRRSGDRVRISAQLIQCSTQASVWSDRFDRTLSDIFELQDEIAGAVSKALELTFAPPRKVAPVDAEAYDLFLRARSNPRQGQAFDPELLEAATARAPGFAAAWAALALTRAQAARAAPTPGDFEPLRARAAEAAERALALDPDAGAAYVALSLLEPVCGHCADREVLINRALAATPNDPVVLNQASAASHAVGRVREAFAFSAHAHEVDPLLPQAANRYAIMLANLGLQTECDDALDRARARWPNYDVLLHNALGFAASAENWARFDELLAGASEQSLGSGLVQSAIREAELQRRWTPADGETLLADLGEELARTGTISLRRLGLACSRGLGEAVFDLAEQASFSHLFEPAGRLPDGDLGLHVLFVPAFAAMRSSPRFPAFCGKLGLCDYWMATGRWPDFAADVAGIYDLKAEARRR